ncbi:MAG: hypothetical protein KDJ36_12755 [Hyphomicrobiaceae bacterium]|nr:hypothetical protein [Hyphomicrobiaceae bacterium]
MNRSIAMKLLRRSPRPARAVLAGLLSASIALSHAAPAFAAQPPAISRAEYEACHTADEAQFRKAVEAITRAALTSGSAKIDYLAIVRDEWRRQDFGRLIDARVDIAVAAVRKESSWGRLLSSLAYREQAIKLATAVAERVYRSDAIKEALDKLALGIGKQIGQSIELTAGDAALPAQKCLRAFLGSRYGDAVARSVTRDTAAAFKIDAKDNRVSVSTGAVIAEASGGLAGAVILLIRRQMARMAQRLGQRLAGAVLSRVVSLVATGVGLVLIAKDAWDFRYGVMPIIADEMKSTAAKEKVQSELASAIKQQIANQMGILAGQTADQILDIWKAFRRNHAKVLDLADKHADFRRLLDSARSDQLARLDEIVGLALTDGGEAKVLARLADGTLVNALEKLPDEGMRIAREVGNLDTALAWSALAPDRLAAVRRYELHQRAKPQDFTARSLTRLLALDDTIAVPRLASIRPDARLVLFELPDPSLKALARQLSVDELATLASYMTGLTQDAARAVLNSVAEAPAKMRILAPARVRDAVLASGDQTAAVAMMLRADAGFDVAALTADVKNVLAGKVHPILMWDKHPAALVGALVLLLLLLLVIRRLFSGGRKTPPHAGNGGQGETASTASGAAAPTAN